MSVEAFLSTARNIVYERTIDRLKRQQTEFDKWEASVAEDASEDVMSSRSRRQQLINSTKFELLAVNAALGCDASNGSRIVFGDYREHHIYLTETIKDNKTSHGAVVNDKLLPSDQATEMWYRVGLPTATVHSVAKYLKSMQEK